MRSVPGAIATGSALGINDREQLDILRHCKLQSGFAYSANITGDANRDGNSATDRVPGTARNAFTTPNIYVFDTRVTKSFTCGEKYKIESDRRSLQSVQSLEHRHGECGTLQHLEFIGDYLNQPSVVDTVWFRADVPG